MPPAVLIYILLFCVSSSTEPPPPLAAQLPESYLAQRDATQRHSPEIVLLHDAAQQHDHSVVRDILHSGA
eukprot:COSAG06_NODE_38783_length_419_cov_12.293750_1_plen_69_part_10